MSQELHSQQTATASAASGSQTITQTSADESQQPSATLRLRAPGSSERRRIQWAEDVVDNEGMGKKSSKVCCIYHKPGQSDSEDSSDSSDSDSDEPDLSRAQKAGGSDRKGRRGRGHKHDQGDGKERRPSPNAYERQPRAKSDRNG